LQIVNKPRFITKNKRYCRNLFNDISRDRYLYLLMIPFIAYYVLFYWRPIWSIRIAFMDYSLYKGFKGSPWVGFEHFIAFFKGPFFWRTLTNTFMLSIYSLIIGFPAPIILALLINEVRNKKFKKITQTLTYIPHFVSTVVVVGIVMSLLSPTSGLINMIIKFFGGNEIYFLAEPRYFRMIYTLMHMWQSTGYSAIIYIAALAGIDQELYEAAVIDGAGRWKQTLHITIPCILPTVVIMLILKLGTVMNVGYEAIILLYNPIIYETADVVSTYVYRSGLQEGSYSFSAAVGLFDSVVSFLLVFFSNKVSRWLSGISLW